MEDIRRGSDRRDVNDRRLGINRRHSSVPTELERRTGVDRRNRTSDRRLGLDRRLWHTFLSTI